MRVLIVKLSSMGDIIHALPVLDYLHQVSPDIEIDWVVEEAFSHLLRGNPLVSNVIMTRLKTWRKRPFSLATMRDVSNTVRQLRERRYDMVFDIQGNVKSGITARLSGCHDRLGFSRQVVQEAPNTWLTTRQVPLNAADYHITDQCLRVVSTPFGKDFHHMELSSDIPTTVDDDTWAHHFRREFENGLVFLFQYGTTWQTKFWSQEGWIELAKQTHETFSAATILMTWGNEAERLMAEQISAATGGGIRVVERLPLGRLVSLLKKVDMVVGGDTGIIHMAAAVGTATVSYYRASDGLRSGPRGKRHAIIQAPMPCSCCFRTSCPRDVECRESIRAEDLLTGMKKVLTQ